MKRPLTIALLAIFVALMVGVQGCGKPVGQRCLHSVRTFDYPSAHTVSENDVCDLYIRVDSLGNDIPGSEFKAAPTSVAPGKAR